MDGLMDEGKKGTKTLTHFIELDQGGTRLGC